MKRLPFSGLVLAIAFAVFAPSARATIAIDPNSPNTFYFSDFGRNLLRSDDAGRTWMLKNAGLPQRNVIAILAIGSPTVLFAATDPGLFVSRDRGDSWSDASSGIDDLRVFSLAASPKAPESIHASTPTGVYNSSDGGRTWTKAAEPVSPFAVSRITSDPTSPFLLYTSVSTALYRSFDAGATWQKTGAVLPVISPNSGILTITVDPNDPATLLILESSLVFPNPHSFYDLRDVFVSHDRGNTVARVPTPFDDDTEALSFDSTSAAYVSDGIHGVAVSLNQGSTWTSQGTIGASEFAPSPNTPRMLALAVHVLYLSDDRGATWTPLASPGCLGLREELCLVGGRFRIQFGAGVGGPRIPGIAVPLTDNAGAFWLFSDNNLEVVVKVVDGRAVNGAFWVFGASLTDLQSSIAVTDMSNRTTGSQGTVEYHQRPGEMRSFADLMSFRDPK